MAMRRSHRFIAVAVLISLSGGLAGCASGGMNNFDPTDMFDMFDTKKKIPGERKPVFPEGVPGVEPGVPRDLYKGNVEREQEGSAPAEAAQPAEQPPPPRASHSRARRTSAPQAASSGAGAAPKRTTKRRSITAPEPETAPPAEQAPPEPQTPASQAPAGGGFPAPLPSGSFQR